MYASGLRRFLQADPFQQSAGAGFPMSWNRFSYTRGDSANRVDPGGLADFSVTTYLIEEPLSGTNGGGSANDIGR